MLLCIPSRMSANNINGGELYFEQVSDSTYRFILKLYWNCENGVPEPTTMPLCFYDGCSLTYSSATMVKDISNPEIPNPCPANPTVCTSTTSTLPGTRLLTYSIPVTLPRRCASWRFYSYYNHRNVVMNLTGNTNFYAEATINNTVYNNNSAAVSPVPDIMYIRQNTPFTYQLTLTDANGDSTRIENAAPLYASQIACTTTTSAVPVISKIPPIIAATNPFQTYNTYIAYQLTKIISFTPIEAGDQIMNIRVREYRAGSQIASYLKEIRFGVIPTSAFNYSISQNLLNPVNCTIKSADEVTACLGRTFSITIDIKSTSPNTYMSVSDNHLNFAPAAMVAYSAQNKDSVRATFQWSVPMTASLNNTLIFMVKDSSCTAGRVSYRSFPITINMLNKPVILSDTTICSGRNHLLTASGGGNTYTWRILPGGTPGSLSCTTCTNSLATPTTTSSYEVTAPESAICGNNKDTATITVIPANTPGITMPSAIFNSSSTTPVTITAVVTNCTSPTFVWKRNNIIIPGATGNTITYLPKGFEVYTCQMTCADKCSNPQTVSATTNSHLAESVEQTTQTMEVAIYPNPSNGSFEIAGFAMKAGMVQYNITNLAGQIIVNGQYTVVTGSYKQTLKTNLPAGVYILKLQDDNNNTAVQKLIIQ